MYAVLHVGDVQEFSHFKQTVFMFILCIPHTKYSTFTGSSQTVRYTHEKYFTISGDSMWCVLFRVTSWLLESDKFSGSGSTSSVYPEHEWDPRLRGSRSTHTAAGATSPGTLRWLHVSFHFTSFTCSLSFVLSLSLCVIFLLFLCFLFCLAYYLLLCLHKYLVGILNNKLISGLFHSYKKFGQCSDIVLPKIISRLDIPLYIAFQTLLQCV